MSSIEIVRVLVMSYGSGVGKSCLVSRLVNNDFDDNYVETASDICSKRMTIDGEPVVLQILDSPGDPNLSDVVVQSMPFADAFMVVYDTSSSCLASCTPLRFSILQEKQDMKPPIVLVGAKCDLKTRTSASSARRMAESWECPFFETSARDNVNVEAAFEQLVREHRAQRRTLVHERRVSSFLSNAFPRWRSWDSTKSFARVLKSGWIHKRGLVRQSWKHRHLEIYEDGSVQYFRRDRDDTPLGEFNLKDVWQVDEYREDGHEDAFVLHTPDRDWFLSCACEEDKDSWLTVITRTIAHFASRRMSACEKQRLSMDGCDAESPRMRSESEMYFEHRMSLTSATSNSVSVMSSVDLEERESMCMRPLVESKSDE